MIHLRFVCAALCTAAVVSAQRGLDPVVLTGDQVPVLIGRDPARLVAFRWNIGWEQVPVQVDERAVVGFDQIGNVGDLPFSSLVYTDPNTFTGADPDPMLDADDEIVFMARHAGAPASFGNPQGTLPGVRVSLTVNDPLVGQTQYLYLFVSDGTLDPSAESDLVEYRFDLLSGDYKTTYNTGLGVNPESSAISTRRYRVEFSDRWILDTANVFVGTATGVDILDRVKFQYQPGVCNRTTDTFSSGPGAMIANVDGPVRAIRSVFGANSGRVTQRDWFCYEGHIQTTTNLRVHPIGGTWNFVDLSTAAIGMTYFDNLNRVGVTVDGAPDSVATGIVDWQMVTGRQGSLTMVHLLDTDIPAVGLQRGSFYFDDASPVWTQCTGDAFAYAASGPATGPLPNTDPLRGPASKFILDQFFYFDTPGLGVADAENRFERAQTAIEVRVQPPYRTFGMGCPSSAGVAQLSAAGVPEPGGAVTIAAAPLPVRSIGSLWFGVSNQFWNGFALPLSLDSIGVPGCDVLVSLDIGVDAGPTFGRAELRVDIPADSALIGVTLFQQFVGFELVGSSIGISLSDAGALTIGG